MECQECHMRPATLHFTKIINGQKTEIHICEHCAKEKGDFHPASNSFSIHNLLSGLLGFEDPIGESPSESPFQQSSSLRCPECGMTYHQFVNKGKFGCAHCYETFQTKLDPVFRRVHGGNTTHKGKIPKRIGGDIQARREMDELKKALQRHIENEEFEQAAKVRDHIRSLERKGE
ncbi:MAG TPA: UvrB/UvrC motif-containing protein [Bacillales bacterium]